MNKSSISLKIISLSLIILGVIFTSCATKPYNPDNKYMDTREVTFNMQTATLTFVEVMTSRGNIKCKEVKNVPTPKQFKDKVVPNTKVPLENIHVKITYTAWTESRERTNKVLNALALQNPASLTNSKVKVRTVFDIPDEYSADIEVYLPKGFNIEYFTKTGDGKISHP